MATRREAMQAGIGGAIMGASGAAKDIARSLISQKEAIGSSIGGFGQFQGCQDVVNKIAPTPPRMEYPQALARILGDTLFRDKLKAEMYEAFRFDTAIDPDLDVLKSLSRMAKLTISRQRRVEREFAQALSVEQSTSLYGPWQNKVMLGIQKLMWGSS